MDLSQGSFDEDVTFAETLLQGIEVQVNETLQKMSKKQLELKKQQRAGGSKIGDHLR